MTIAAWQSFRLKLAVQPNVYVGTLGVFFGAGISTLFGRLLSVGLPDLRGNVPIHVGQGHTLGEKAGEQAHTLTISELPQHVHFEKATTNTASTNTPANTLVLAQSTSANLYASGASNLVAMAPDALTNVGGSQAHQNMQPYLVINFCIALQGIFPSQN